LFWERYKELCEENNLTPNGAAKEMGFSSSIVTYWSRGTNPSLEKLEIIASFFKVPIEYLTGKTDERTQRAARSPNGDARALIDDLEMLHKSPELRVLLSASAKLTKSDVEAITEIALRMNKERDEG
jgi:transcriptional regulator with XRE-family HTH domain